MVDIENMVEPLDIAEIDFQALSASSPQQRLAALQQLDDAFKSYGIIYLSNHSIGQAMIDEAISWAFTYSPKSRRFFDLPSDIKKMIEHPRKAGDHRGWIRAGIGYVTQGILCRDPAEVESMHEKASVEQMESLETGKSHLALHTHARNRLLPEETLPGFQSFYAKWWAACVNQELQILRALCEILDISDLDYLGKQQTPDINCSQFGWNHYPSTPISSLKPGGNRLNTHSDYGQLTFLFQDDVGGLESQDEAGIFRPVQPRRGTMIVQVADMLERQSNGRWRSALHRVTTPPRVGYDSAVDENEELVDRYSIAFFAIPDYDTVIESLPGCEMKGKWHSLPWKEETTAGAWLMKRVALEYERK
ncbi:oxidoreductase 2OG-Fe(II) oxygenase family [Penicillium angulare]|uniref:oxidoreductase 2OG-Fe(II) oxygenase family n=1 Tax=Penicillium angulare TaxID=116970 RepID=UPI0025407300|nr:oxidoreductase 2OG-Fe(II) oxygenase family [Penicillium angulare]KAJ5266631.1 oxidoreductase 2OG-Fe(II) oxygenase family [Penicillium angulare]